MRRNGYTQADRIREAIGGLTRTVDELEKLFYGQPLTRDTAEIIVNRLQLAAFFRGQLIGLGRYPMDDDQEEQYISDVLSDIERAVARGFAKGESIKSNGRRR
jgi:hypothetical protein